MVKYEIRPGEYIVSDNAPKKKMYKAMRHTEYRPLTPNDALPIGFETARELVMELKQNILTKNSLYYVIYVRGEGGSVRAAALESKEMLDFTLVNSLDSGERVMRVGKASEITGERIFDWTNIPDDFVWALNGGNEATVDFIRHTVFSYQTRKGENGTLNATTTRANTISKGLSKGEIERMSDKRMELWNDNTAGYFAKHILEHRWFGYINPYIYGFRSGDVKLPDGLPSGSYTLHDILLGNYQL